MLDFTNGPGRTQKTNDCVSLVISGMNAWDIAAELERTVVAVRARAERVGVSLRQVRIACPRRLVELGLKVKK
jgi:hypothetical protein